MKSEACNTNTSVVRRSIRYFRGHRLKLFCGVLIALAGTVVGVGSGYTLKILVDDILLAGDIRWIWPIQLLFLLFVFTSSFLGVYSTKIFSGICARILDKIRGGIFAHVLKADYLAFNQLSAGAIHTTINYGVDNLEGLISRGIPEAASSIIGIAIYLSAMFVIDWRLALLSLPVYPVLILINGYMQKKLHAIQAVNQRNRANVNNDIEEGIKCRDNIWAFNLFDYMNQRFGASVGALHKNHVRFKVIVNILNRTSWMFIMVPYQAILYGIGGSWFILNGNPTIGTLLIFANFTNSLIGPVMSLVNFNSSVSSARAGYERIDELTALPRQKNRVYDACAALDGAVIEFNGLRYQYGSGGEAVFDEFSRRFKQNSATILWGPSGCGKSTLLKLIYGFLYPQEKGQIRLADMGDSWLRDGDWAYLPQNPYLFNITLRENFQIVNPEIEEEGMWRLLDTVNLKRKFVNLENGLDYELVNSDKNLSGGEHKRLCLAVFLAYNANILLFDEPTANLDYENSRIISEAFRRVKARGDKTLIIATHDQNLKSISDELLEL